MHDVEIDRALLIETFVAEAGELLAHLEETLVALEARPGDGELLHALFRDAHTLKGGASLVGFDAVKDLAHELEDVLERLRDGTLAVGGALVTTLLRAVDLLRSSVGRAAAGNVEADGESAAFRRRLAQVAAGAGAASSTPAEGTRSERTEPAERASAVTLRVDVAKLDRMLDLAGEIAVARGRLDELLERGVGSAEVLEAHRDADRLHLDLQELVMKARMVPIGPTFHPYARTVRDLALAHGKQVRLVFQGEDVEVDTAVAEHVRDPLGHMVRNALDHGIEAPAVRRAAGKDPTGEIVLRAFHEAGSIVIQIADDGAGLDRARIAERAVALGLAEEASRVTDEEAAALVFEPGFSTAARVTDVSGRGVGMDVVRRNVEALRGSVTIESERGRGTAITLRLPLTLAMIQGFRVRVADETYILPLDAVVECLELPAGEAAAGSQRGILPLRGKPLPYVRLRDHFSLPGDRPRRENVVVVRHEALVAGLVVDALVGECSTVLKPLASMFDGVVGVSGSSILGNGRVALVLDAAALLRDTVKRAARAAA